MMNNNTLKLPAGTPRFFSMLGVIFILVLSGSLLNSGFHSPANIGNILAMTSILAMAAAGQTFVMISGAGVDISIGATMSLGAIITVQMQNLNNGAIMPSVLVLILVGAAVGLFNGLGVVKARVPALVLTYSTANILMSIQLIVTGGTPDGKPAPLLSQIGTSRLFPWLPSLLLVFAALFVIVHLLFKNTVLGRQFFLIGSNKRAAEFAGMKPDFVQILAFVLCGVFSTLAGMWFAAFNTFIKVGSADYLNLPVLAAVLIGGVSFMGGTGSYRGSVVGALILTLVNSLLVMLSTTEPVKQIINGLILLVLLFVYNREPKVRQ